MSTERDLRLEGIRVLAMLAVIAIHVLGLPRGGSGIAGQVLTTVLFAGNGLFFLLSGQLNLSREFHSGADTARFYLRRACTILLPLLITTMVLYAMNVVNYGQRISVGTAYISFMSTYSGSYLWFVYVLTGCLLSAPILSRAVHSMSTGELHAAFAAGIAWQTAAWFLTRDLNIPFAFSGWVLEGRMLFFYAGYYLTRVLNDRNRRVFLGLGAAGLAVSLIAMRVLPVYQEPYTQTPDFILFTIGLYVLLRRYLTVPRWAAGLTRFWGRHSFTIYLSHVIVLQDVYPLLGLPEHPAIVFPVVLALCTGLAAAVDAVLFPLEKTLSHGLEKLFRLA